MNLLSTRPKKLNDAGVGRSVVFGVLLAFALANAGARDREKLPEKPLVRKTEITGLQAKAVALAYVEFSREKKDLDNYLVVIDSHGSQHNVNFIALSANRELSKYERISTENSVTYSVSDDGRILSKTFGR